MMCRRFLFVFICVLQITHSSANATTNNNVVILHDNSSLQFSYAARKLGDAFENSGYVVKKQHSKTKGNKDYEFLISLALHPLRLEAEAFSIIPQDKVITIYGGDKRGMIYGALALVEMLGNGIKLNEVQTQEQKPHLEFRGIKYNLPWETYRPSSALNQHQETAKDLK
jgi:hypothetical protein